MPIPATPAMPTAEKSSLRSTFSMSRWEIMFPAVARRSPAITTPSRLTAATIVVPCGMSAPPPPPLSAALVLAGSSPGAATLRKSENDDVPALRYGAGSCPPPP